MAQYDVYPDPAGWGFLLDVQTDLLTGLNTRIVVPLMLIPVAPKRANRLNPIFRISGEPHSMVTQYLSSLPQSLLKAPIENLADEAESITAALDMITHGF